MPGHFTFYCNYTEGDVAHFDETEAKHALKVLRYGVGDTLHFTDGKGSRFTGTITSDNKQGFQARILERQWIEKPSSLFVNVAILKSGDRMEWAVEKCTELGVSGVVFFQSDNGERGKVNLARMQKVAIAAMKQSHGAWLPEIIQSSFAEALSATTAGKKYIAYCGEADKVGVAGIELPACIFIGPEGDFSAKELKLAMDTGCVPLDLGVQILRTETAMVAILASLRLR
jgi:16S rRNA (uracil1498-N3)-methyltransferase